MAHKSIETKYYEERIRQAANVGFNKRRVAEEVLRLVREGTIDDETKENLEKLRLAILRALGVEG